MSMVEPTLDTDPSDYAAMAQGAAIDAAVESTGHLPGYHDNGPQHGAPVDVVDLFTDVAEITAWLDASNQTGPHEDAMRVLKLTEEAGEAAAAYIGMVGQNPRKGVTHTLDDVLSELADVAVTALCAIQHFTQSETTTRALVNFKAAHVAVRAGHPRT